MSVCFMSQCIYAAACYSLTCLNLNENESIYKILFNSNNHKVFI